MISPSPGGEPQAGQAPHPAAVGPGRTLYVEAAGSGRDIVLIHGAMTTHADWLGDLFDGFASRGRVHAVDRPGHGLSVRARFRASPLQQARQIRDQLRQHGVSRPILVGHSFGALVASAWAAAHPDEIAGLVLVSPIAFQELRLVEQAGFGPRALPVVGPMLAQMAAPLDRAMLPVIQKIMFAPADPPANWLARYPVAQVLAPPALVAEGEDAATTFPGWPSGWINYFAITAPIRILAGARDHVVDPLRHAGRLAWLLRRAELHLEPHGGHMVHHTAPAKLFEAVDGLMAEPALGKAV